MSLQNEIKEKMKEALKAKDKLRLEVLRGLSAAFVNELVAQGKKPDEEIDDSLATKVLNRALKQRKEATEQFKAGGREDLAQKEFDEAKIIEEFLPEQMSDEELEEIVKNVIDELGKDAGMGKLMPALMQKVGPSAPGARVKETLEKFINK